jgi:hypothetical protein
MPGKGNYLRVDLKVRKKVIKTRRERERELKNSFFVRRRRERQISSSSSDTLVSNANHVCKPLNVPLILLLFLLPFLRVLGNHLPVSFFQEEPSHLLLPTLPAFPADSTVIASEELIEDEDNPDLARWVPDPNGDDGMQDYNGGKQLINSSKEM